MTDTKPKMSDFPTHESYEGEWVFFGGCAPKIDDLSGHGTFTLGCFQWVRMAGKSDKCVQSAPEKSLKRGKVQHRVKGVASDPADAYYKADNYCKRMNGGAA